MVGAFVAGADYLTGVALGQGLIQFSVNRKVDGRIDQLGVPHLITSRSAKRIC